MTERTHPEYKADGSAILARISAGLPEIIANYPDYYDRRLQVIDRSMGEDLELSLGAFTDLVDFPSRLLKAIPPVVFFLDTITTRKDRYYPRERANARLFEDLSRLVTGSRSGNKHEALGITAIAATAQAALKAKKSRAEIDADNRALTFTDDEAGPIIYHPANTSGRGVLQGIQLRLTDRLYANVRSSNLYTLERPIGKSAIELLYRPDAYFS